MKLSINTSCIKAKALPLTFMEKQSKISSKHLFRTFATIISNGPFKAFYSKVKLCSIKDVWNMYHGINWMFLLSPWTLCFFRPKFCLGLFRVCWKTRPVHALLNRCLIPDVSRARQPSQKHPDNHVEMIPLTNPTPTAQPSSPTNQHTPPPYHSLTHMPRLSQSPQWSVPLN